MSSKPVAPVKKSVSKNVSTPVEAPVVVAPVKTAAPKSAPASRSVSPAVVAPEPVVVADAVVERSLQDELKDVQDQLTAARDAATAGLLALKRLAKRAASDVKDAKKKKRSGPKEESDTPRKPSNFEIPVAISDELSAFFGGGKGALMSRAEVNKRMFAYAKENLLSQGQTIHLEPTAALVDKASDEAVKAGGSAFTAAQRDAATKRQGAAGVALRKLLALPAGEHLTIFNIQTYMGRHYPKPATKA
jgi:hypothetical protein